MKTILLSIILTALLISSGIVGYKAATSWNNEFLFYASLVFFAIFWACILALSIKVKPVDNISAQIEDNYYTRENTSGI